jgi:hypothetical protein
VSLCVCDQLVDACLDEADGPDGLCGRCRHPEGLCGKRRMFGALGEVVNQLRRDVDRG